ncbi:MAG: SRPBCC family protein, partial [Actinomycetota bacterium]
EAEGTISTTPDGRAVLRFERRLNHSVDRVWAAVSQPDEMEAWLAFKARLEPEVGGGLSLWLGDSTSQSPVYDGEVTVFDPLHALEARMADGSVLRFEVTPAGEGGSVLVFTDTRPSGERARNSVLAGWHLRMDLLGPALDGERAEWLEIDARRDEHGYVAEIAEIYWHYRTKPRD